MGSERRHDVKGPSTTLGSERRAAPAALGKTFVEFGTERLQALQIALGIEHESSALRDVFQLLLRPWGHRRLIGDAPYRSNVADDQAPFEFSLALAGGSPELQVYVDPQAERPAPRANLLAARALLDVVASELGTSLERLHEIEDLFCPSEPAPPFGLWIGASWARERGVRLKIYLNPHVQGRAENPRLVGEAMRRLGFSRAWSRLQHDLSLGDGRDEIGIVSLDLSSSGSERLKLYVRHYGATAARIASVTRLTREHSDGEVAAFYTALARGSGPFEKKPAASVLAFVEPRSEEPAGASLEFPIGSYVRNDADARERIESCFGAFGLSPEAYSRAIDAFATRPLADRAGIHAHVTLRRVSGAPRLAVYLASEAYVPAEIEA